MGDISGLLEKVICKEGGKSEDYEKPRG